MSDILGGFFGGDNNILPLILILFLFSGDKGFGGGFGGGFGDDNNIILLIVLFFLLSGDGFGGFLKN